MNLEDVKLTEKELGLAVGIFNMNSEGVVATRDNAKHIIPEGLIHFVQASITSQSFSPEGQKIAWGLHAKLWMHINSKKG